ncbi:MAG TPA: hypothetical protein VGR81_06360 [Candidatus Acidoferrales bacterium]|nr:hypothetical protein [Candidatus Acidoferrales bacterium]
MTVLRNPDDLLTRTSQPTQSNPLQRIFAWLFSEGLPIVAFVGFAALVYFFGSARTLPPEDDAE